MIYIIQCFINGNWGPILHGCGFKSKEAAQKNIDEFKSAGICDDRVWTFEIRELPVTSE